jgi:phage-related protein
LRALYGKDKIRILYFADARRAFIRWHGFVKRTAKLEASELRQAELRRARHNLQQVGQTGKKGKHRA